MAELRGAQGIGIGEDGATSGPGDGRGPLPATEGKRSVGTALELGWHHEALRSRPSYGMRARFFFWGQRRKRSASGLCTIFFAGCLLQLLEIHKGFLRNCASIRQKICRISLSPRTFSAAMFQYLFGLSDADGALLRALSTGAVGPPYMAAGRAPKDLSHRPAWRLFHRSGPLTLSAPPAGVQI